LATSSVPLNKGEPGAASNAQLPTLRRELIAPFVILFAGALYVGVLGIAVVIPKLPPARVALYVAILLLADVSVFAALAFVLLRKRLFIPIEKMIAAVEDVSSGQDHGSLPQAETLEMARLSASVSQMAERLIADQQALQANIESLDDTNLLLTEARDAMVRTEKLASVGRLSSGIAHEIGNPLGAIVGYMALLERGETDSKRHELIVAAQREAQRIDRIVRGLLDFARPREAVSQHVDMNVVLAETVELVQTQGRFSGIEVRLEPAAHPAIVAADPYQIQQVMVNLFVNAVDAMEDLPARSLSIRCAQRPAAAPVVELPARRKEDPPGINYSHRRRLVSAGRSSMNDPETTSGSVVEVFVRDSGSGIPVQMLEQVFEPFVTTKDPGRGTGLGLALCSRLIESMGGVIRARNAETGGAEFHIILPALHAEEKP
jgi:two-component system, NtrC family, sensor kinase